MRVTLTREKHADALVYTLRKDGLISSTHPTLEQGRAMAEKMALHLGLFAVPAEGLDVVGVWE